MPAAALLALACLLGASPEVPTPVAPPVTAAPPSAPVSSPTPPSAPSSEAAPAPVEPVQGEGAASREAPARSVLVDPWADVPIQVAVPKTPAPAATITVVPRTSTRAPLLDPWAGGARRGKPRAIDPELRDPFRSLRAQSPSPRLARADLRDPFARPSSPAAAAPVEPEPAAVRSEPPAAGMPMHPDLRDPFGRRKARPTPPPARVTPGDTRARPPAPLAPPSSAAPGREPSPRSGAFLPAARPFAHLPRLRRPA